MVGHYADGHIFGTVFIMHGLKFINWSTPKDIQETKKTHYFWRKQDWDAWVEGRTKSNHDLEYGEGSHDRLKKSTKKPKICKKTKGEHQGVWVEHRAFGMWLWEEFVCELCGKKLNRYFRRSDELKG